jgi:hypothetical protein
MFLSSINYSLHTQLHSFVKPAGRFSHSLVFLGSDNIIDLKNHLYHLSCKFQLVLLGGCRLENTLFLHVLGALVVSINTDERALLLDLCFTHF